MKSSYTTTSSGPGWYPDPRGRGQRYWDGHGWTKMTRADTTRRSNANARGGGWVGISGRASSPAGY